MEVEKKVRDGVAMIEALTGMVLTDEQKEIAYRFNDSMSVFANPGSGKTTVAVSGLIAAQTVHGIPGKSINAMSFTKLATAELSTRYKAACKKCNINANINFNTFHSLCYRIIKKVYPKFEIKFYENVDGQLKNYAEYLKAEGVVDYEDMYFVKRVYNAMNSLNNELLYAKESVESSSKFIAIQEGITIKQFQIVRNKWFKKNLVAQAITQGEIPTMALFILMLNPDLVEELREEFELMIVDEFQDKSVLYLEVLSMISRKLIVIGDLKQQIYGFNGASLLILEAYKQMYPEAPTLELTQSFRCNNEIVEQANEIIAPNDIEGYLNFKGNRDGGEVNIIENYPGVFDEVMEDIKKKQELREVNDIMFLSRNNASVVPIIERLYKSGIAFRTTRLAKVMDLPIFRDLCIMAEVALNPTDKEKVKDINRFMPEFLWVHPKENAILTVMDISPRETDKSILTMNYSFNEDSSYTIINKLRRFVELHEAGESFGTSMKPLLDIYEEFVLDGKWWKLEQSKEYYFNLVESIIKDKTYTDMVYDEHEKYNKNEYYCSVNEGIRCYTFHSSKGLEAEEVYLIDVDEDIVPKKKSMDKLIEDGCLLDAAKELRNERNLLYVAATRSKSKLTIIYNDKISRLISSPDSNEYSFLDEVWREKAVLKNETNAFKLLLGVK